MKCRAQSLAGIAVAAWAAAGGAWAQAASAPAIPYRPAVESDSPGAQQWVLAVLGCALLLAVMLYLLRRFGTRLSALANGKKQVQVIERTPLANNVQLVVVEYGQRRMLLSVSAATTICLRDDALAETPPPAATEGMP